MSIIETFTKKRSEITAKIRELNASLVHLDATIKMFALDHETPRAKHGDVTRKLFDALRESQAPMTTREIADKTGIDMKRAGIALNAQEKKGLVTAQRGQDGCNVWKIN